MTNSKEDKDFNETLKRLMEKDPKPHEAMKKGRSLATNPSRDKGKND